MIQKRLIVKGERVQGVNYRETACVIARRMHIKGITKNLDDGTVEILCECEDQKHLDEFIGKLIIRGKYENDPVVEKVIATDDKVTRELGYFNIDYGTDEDLQKELLIKIAVGDNSIKEMRTDMTDRFNDMDKKYGEIGENLKGINDSLKPFAEFAKMVLDDPVVLLNFAKSLQKKKKKP